ncbi:galactokinase [Nocardioides sp. KR10-350]|uniref:galactokinase n=1 Tax=Nocardioides cheoyonin TaxID=3156615 RepID=UPI0032B37243
MVLLAPGSAAELAERARAGLRDTFGSEAAVVGRAPGRVNLIGEHTDYNGGLVLPVALPHATYAAAAPRSDGVVRLASAQEPDPFTGIVDHLGPGEARGWSAYAGGVLWALREAGHDLPGLDLYVDSSVPLGAGLSSSAAIECAVAMAAVGILGLDLDDPLRAGLVAACIRAETEVADAPTGGMDQTVAIHGQAGTALLIDFGVGTHEPVALALRDRTILVTDTRVKHALTDGGYGARRADCEKAAAALGVRTLRDATLEAVEALTDDVVRRRARHIVTEIARVRPAVDALGAADWPALGELFAASHASMRDDFEISTPELDLAVSTAVASGADAARMTGGGFGGSIVAVLPTAAVDDVVRAIDHAFSAAGYRSPGHLLVEPSAGASLVG